MIVEYTIFGLCKIIFKNHWLKAVLVIKNDLIDQLKQTWNSTIENSPKYNNYFIQ